MNPKRGHAFVAAAVGYLLAPALLLVPSGHATTTHSILPTAGNPYAEQQGKTYGRVVRLSLTDQEARAAIPVGLELNLQEAGRLQSHIDHGDILTRNEIEGYLPSQAAYNAVKDWLVQQGFVVTLESNLRHAIFVRGTVQQCSAAFQTTFARVATSDGEFTSALVEPTLPTAISSSVRLVRGLQTHLLRHHLGIHRTPDIVPNGFMGPATLTAQYNAPDGLTGAGETIAILGDDIPSTSDLTLFWTTCNIPQSLSRYTVVKVQGGPVNAPATGLDMKEAELDVQWASGIASGAAIRFYAVPYPLSDASELAAYAQILNDLPANPGLHEVSESFAGEEMPPSSTIQLLAAQGVSCFAGSGDGGSNPNMTSGIYDSTQPLAVEYPACDPNVTGVGGTSLALGTNGQLLAPEIAWYSDWPSGNPESGLDFASGGGISASTPRPSWQTGTGVPPGMTRCVPDVSVMASPCIGSQICGLFPMIIENGEAEGAGCTSFSSPVWAGFCALINQSLANAGLKPVGLLNAKIYPLIGTSAFSDITTGTNGAYSADIGYDLCTGVGTPNLANLIAALEAGPPGLSVTVPSTLPPGIVTNGSSPFTLTALAAGGPTGFQWYLNGTAIAGATSSTLIVSPTAANEGTYSVTVTNVNGSASAPAGYLSVATDAWLTNLSARAYTETGTNQLIAGFVTTGTSDKSLLIRGDGPALGGFGIIDFLPDPQLSLISGSTTVATATSWATSLDVAFARVGAFAFASGSHDTALLESLAPGAYSAQVVSQTANNGVAIAEIYDADSTAPTNRLVNISARAFVGTGANILIGGFVIGGTTPQTVIIRGDGPALQGFGLSGALANPVLTLTNSAGTIATNAGWSNAPVSGGGATGDIVVQPLTAALSEKVGAFALTDGSGDSAIVATLPPGAYTAEVAGVNGNTGVALIEIYELQ